jgi:hypothetical protein
MAFGVALLAPLAAPAQTTVTLTFEGLQDNEEILNYYNGGMGGSGSGPGPNYGVVFGSGALSSISESAGGTGNFALNPSGITTAYFLTGGGLVMNVAAGFTGGFSFYYASGDSTGTVTVYDGLNASGNVLATVPLPATGSGCGGLVEFYTCWDTSGVSFTGTALSVNFAGADDGIGFDNITLGSKTPNVGVIVVTPSLAGGFLGVAYSQALAASGGTAPYTWTAKGLPPGLNIDPTSGTISGVPTVVGTYPVTVTATESNSVPTAAPLSGSNTYSLVIAPPANPALTSLAPATAVAGSGDLTMTVNGTGFSSTSVVTWTPQGGTLVDLPTTFSSSVLQATVSAALLASPGTAAVTVVNSATSASGPLAFTITTPATPTLTSLVPANAAAPAAALTIQVNGTNFTQAAVVQWTPAGGTTTNLATTFQSATTLQAAVPAALLATPGTAAVTVADLSTVVSSPLTFTINAPAVPAGLSLVIPTPGVLPTDQPAITVTLSSPALADYAGTIQLNFTPASGVSGWPANQTNSQVVFTGGSNTTTFTIAQGATTGTLPNSGVFQQGTVAGTITAVVTVVNGNALPGSSQPSVTQVVQALAPVITSGSVQITGVSATGFTVELTAYSTTRDLGQATFTFTAASGATLTGTSQTVSLSSAATPWFASSAGLQAGGSFTLSVPFAYSGSTSALGSVSVTVSNSVGTSAAQAGQ